MMKLPIAALILLISVKTYAAQPGDWFISPHISAGQNTVQGTNFRLGVDAGLYFSENVRLGVGGYYAFGEKPRYDREIGAGPFVAYVLPFNDFLTLSFRQDLHYIDARIPATISTPTGPEDSYIKETGVIAGTGAAVHISLTDRFALWGGYRYVLALGNSALDNGRSGPIFGFGIGI